MPEEGAKLQAVLEQHGLAHCSMAIIGADKLPEFSEWHVMFTSDSGPKYLDVVSATGLAHDLRKAGESHLAQRIERAVETAKAQMRREAGDRA